MKKIFLFSLMSSFLFVSCKKDEEKNTSEDSSNGGSTPAEQYKLIDSENAANDLIIELYADSEMIEVGYTPIYVKVKDLNGDAVSNATVELMPMMDMGMMQHSSPLEQPNYNSTSKYYEGMVIFTMPSGMNSWTLDVMANGESVTFDIEVNDSPANTKYVGSYTGTDGESYIVSLVKPNDWAVGMNDVSFMVHKNESMMSYVPMDNFTMEMGPQMTSMGHGSPNNISPSNQGNGYYQGEVNFTMTGDWRLNLDLVESNDTIVSANIDILF
ncbi:FixH family protein [Brumimicrobium aurantiacum]|uniref:YtkA-like domain-containing protein n=1 Tax=Brumimicrobium aurantiacum TaxID=1737063 RepID=A0A3E1F0Q6_9FLAO|nr:FixH family protein [Brumimicrobium aurantiacum]RFC55396.1 hypothetical protein DXU93_00220 [Brumimicrobium aurantiacum]